MRQAILFLLLLTHCTVCVHAQDIIQWRNDRTGVYNETGLLQSWGANGPKLLWEFNGLDEGFTSVAISNNKLYVTGLTGENGFLYVLDLSGKLLNKKTYGHEWNKSHSGTRSTVTIHDGKLYVVSGVGNIVCMDEQTLTVIWQKDFLNEFKGKNIMWGITESPLIVDDKIILTPGGETHNIVALNKDNGQLKWTSKGEGTVSSYCSPIYLPDQQVPQIVTMMSTHILAINAKTGEKVWSFPYENFRKIHPNSPVYSNNMLLCTSGYRKGSVMLRLTNGGRNVEQVWESKDLETKHGGIVKIGDFVYGSGDENSKNWFCLDWNTGRTLYKDNALGIGATITADGMLYCFSESKKEMFLVKPTPTHFEITGKFPVKQGTGEHWAHPVIYKGVLYVRRGNTLMAYSLTTQ